MEEFKENDESSDYVPFIARNTPYTGSLENNIPYVYSVPFNQDYVDENISFSVTQLNEQIAEKFNNEGLKPVCYTHYQGRINDFFPNGVTMALFQKDGDENFVMYAAFNNFIVEGKIYGGKSDYVRTTTVDLSRKERREGFIEIYRDRKERELGNIVEVLIAWSDKLKKNDLSGAQKIFDTLSNDKAFKGFAPKEIWNTPLKKNPLLVLTRKCFAAYFNQPTVKDANPGVKF